MPVMPTSALDAELNDVLDEPNREADHDFTPGVQSQQFLHNINKGILKTQNKKKT